MQNTLSLPAKLVLAVYFFIIPLDYVLPHIGNATLLTPVGAVLAFLCLLRVINYNKMWFTRDEVILALLLILCALSITWASNLSAAVSYTISFAMTVVLYFLLMICRYSEAEVRLVENASILGGILLVLYVFTQVDLSLVFAGYRLDFNNIGGSEFSDPNGLSGRLMMPLVMMIKRVFEKNHPAVRISCAVSTFLMLFVIFLTGSRAGILAICIAGLVIIPSVARGRVQVFVMAGLFLVAAFVYLPTFLPEHIYERIFGFEKYTEVTTLEGDRIHIWTRFLWDVFPQSPIWGVGAGNSPYAMEPIYGKIKAMHNTHLVFLADFGLIGFVPWMLYLFRKFKSALAVRKINPYCLAVFLSVLFISATLDAAKEKYLWNALLYAYMNYSCFVMYRRRERRIPDENSDAL